MNKIIPLRPEAADVQLSAIVPVTGRHDDPEQVYRAYRAALEATGLAWEVVYVLDAPTPALEAALRALQAQGEPISLISLTQRFGESVDLHVGLQHARGERLLLLPPYLQIEPAALPAMVAALDRVDLVSASRDRSGDHRLNRARDRGLRLVARLAGARVSDLGCLVHACRRKVLEEVLLHDEHHRFLPLLAQTAGFAVELMTLPQAAADRRFRPHGPSMYLGRLLDLFAIAFLLRFMQRPFRFFGTVGVAMAVAGLGLGGWLVVQRLVLGMPLAERPALLLATMLVMLGLQVAVVGLIAELIVFGRSGRLATYKVDRVFEQAARPDDGPSEMRPSA